MRSHIPLHSASASTMGAINSKQFSGHSFFFRGTRPHPLPSYKQVHKHQKHANIHLKQANKNRNKQTNKKQEVQIFFCPPPPESPAQGGGGRGEEASTFFCPGHTHLCRGFLNSWFSSGTGEGPAFTVVMGCRRPVLALFLGGSDGVVAAGGAAAFCLRDPSRARRPLRLAV